MASDKDLRNKKYQGPLTRLPPEIQHNIVQYLSVNTLRHLAAVSKNFYAIATPILYRKDARDERPRAIFWAASYISNPTTERTILKVLHRAISYGGNVNHMYSWGSSYEATPLHLASTRGNIKAAKKLLQHGANPNALGRYIFRDPPTSLSRRKLESYMPNSTITVASRHSKWRPLFVPFLLQDMDMIGLLLRHGASPVLSIPIGNQIASAFDPGTINILHILSALEKEEITHKSNLLSFFKKYSEVINVPILQGATPLFFSLERGNEVVLQEIMANGGNIEDVNEVGRTPLMQAITHYCRGETPEIRKQYKGIIEYLIKSCNAKVGNLGDARVRETPLICTITNVHLPVPARWKRAIADIRRIITLLLEHGADPNEISNRGFTLLHTLCDIICRHKHTGGLLDLFGRLVEDGADLNIPFPNGQSVLEVCITRYNCRPAKFYKLLLKLDA
ncbi:ankyrin repeat-containing domain protein [Trichoderma barbatum]